MYKNRRRNINFAGMKKGMIKYVFVLLSVLMFCPDVSAQFKVYTRKNRLSDFPAKTTMVVLGENEILNITLRNEIKSRWRVSPFDFCYEDDMQEIKNNPSFYILYLKEEKNGIIFLNLEKCGDRKGVSSLESRMNVIKVPFCPKGFSSGREILYTSAMIDVMQRYMEKSIIHSQASYKNLEQSCTSLAKSRRKPIYIDSDDLCENLKNKDRLPSVNGITFTDSYIVDSLLTSNSSEALIGFCISSPSPGGSSESYQVIVSADRHELLYYKKTKYKKKGDRGFTEKALAGIRTEHSYKR